MTRETEPGWRHKIEWLHALARTPGVPPADIHLAVLLTVYAASRPPFDRCRPSIQTLADDAGTTRSKVSERLRDFRLNGWLAVVHQGGGRKSTTEYQLTQGAPGWRRYPYQKRLSVPTTGTVEADVYSPPDGDSRRRHQSPSGGRAPSPSGGRAPSPSGGQEPCTEPGTEPGMSMAESSKHRPVSTARPSDDADATRQDEPRPNPSRAADVREIANRLAHARGIPT
jgi:hypothetical protein